MAEDVAFAPRAWKTAVAPIIARCEVAAKFGHSAVWNADGADALGKLLGEMARIIDDEITARAEIQRLRKEGE